MKYETDQETFWAGAFGSEYIDRNIGETLLASNIAFFSKALAHAAQVSSCIEFGANIGMNIKALQILQPHMENHAIEINALAVSQLKNVIPEKNIFHTSILDFLPTRTWDLALAKGILIHINPASLPQVYGLLYKVSNRYILICEYYNPKPVAITYRGHENRLFKRDFCSEMLNHYPDLKLVDYGFAYHRDPKFPQDDINWFLLEKHRQI